MLAAVPAQAIDQIPELADRYARINAVRISGDQLNSAFQQAGALGNDGVAVLTAFAKRERIDPLAYAPEALMLRMALVADFLDGPGIEHGEWDDMLEVIARVKLVDDPAVAPIGNSGVCFDEVQFDELLMFVREIPW